LFRSRKIRCANRLKMQASSEDLILDFKMKDYMKSNKKLCAIVMAMLMTSA